MKKKILLLALFAFCIIIFPKETYAFSSENYKNKSLCGNYEVAGMHSDGVIDPVACLNTFEEAQAWMKKNGADDLVVFGKVAGKTKILDANLALVDLSVNPETLTYFYTDKEKTSSYTYMDTGSLYGGVDGALISASYSNAHGRFVIKVKIGNFTGWILDTTYEIVPLTWVKSSSSYTVTNENIKHNYVNKIQETFGEYEIINSLYGHDAEERLKKEKFELILIDDELKNESGIEVLKLIKEKTKKPIIIMIDKNKEFMSEHYIEDGFTNYVIKQNIEEELKKIK